MGSLRFAAKALLICVVFLVPLVWLSWPFESIQNVNIGLSAKERLGAQPGTARAYAAMPSAYAAAATDASNLTLDPDIDSCYLMDAAFFRIPDIVETSGKLRGLGLAIMAAGAKTPPPQQLLSETIPIAEFQFRNMRDGLQKSYAANLALQHKLATDPVLASTEAFFKLARQSVITEIDQNPEAQSALRAAANQAMESQYALASRLMDELDTLLIKRVSAMESDRTIVTAALAVGLLLAGYLFYCFYLVSDSGLKTIARHLNEMSAGDLRDHPHKPWSRDEAAGVLLDLITAYDSLHALIRKVRHGARELHTASNEIAAASTDLAARTEASAAALEQQASAMEEIASIVGNTAANAQEAARFAADNALVAERGGKIIAEVVTTMQGIHASSAKINDIIGVIDGIAFQTNILALNAAVEAARAGESSRGFAVVASEAQRSAGAAKEMKTLIGTSVEQVEQVEQSIQELDRTTRQNAALVEETNAAACALREQAELLQQEIANFKVA